MLLNEPIDSDGDGIDDVYELRHGVFLNPLDPADARLDFDHDGLSNLEEYQRGTDPTVPALLTLRESSPAQGETGVSVTRETIFRLSQPLASDTLITLSQLYATFGGRRLLSRTELSSDRKTVTLFYLETLPGSARVRVTFDGSALKDSFGRPVDLDGDGVHSGVKIVDFDTLSLTPLANTAVIGHVFASDPAPGVNPGDFVNRPLAGVRISVDGMEETLFTTTDSEGSFRLEPVPPGHFFVHIDGRTAAGSSWPHGAYYPAVGKQWEAVAGRANNLAGGTGLIYLPFITADTLQPVSMTSDTTIRFPPSVIANNPSLAGVSIMVPANSLFSDNGTRGGMVGIAPVPPDRLPGPLPEGLEFPLVITVQTDGGLNFDKPVPVCFPNLPDPATGAPLPPGTKNFLYSFNHDKGIWEAIGPMTVSEDGRMICTEVGVGIRQPGWHGSGPPPDGPPPPPPPPGCPMSAFVASAASNNSLLAARATGGLAQCIKRCGDDALRCHTYCVLGGVAGFAACAFFGPFSPACAAGVGAAVILCDGKCFHDKFVCEARCKEDNPPCTAASQIVRLRSPLPTPLTPFNQNAGVDQIFEKLSQLGALIYPYAMTTTELPPELQGQATNLLLEANQLAGGDAVTYLRNILLQYEADAAPLEAEIGEAAGNAPPYPVLYLAAIARSGGIFRLRGTTGPNGQYSIFVPRDGTLLSVSFYDPRAKSFGMVYPRVRPNAPYRLPRFYLHPVEASFQDFDADGLSDVVEFVYGTDPGRADTDGDGIKDGAEVDQGTNPLDGLPARTGIIATAKTPGAAVDISAFNDLAVVAELDRGVSVLNVLNGANPTIVAQVDTPGSAQRIAFFGNLVAVADGAAGLAIIDMTDPPAARIVHQVPLGNTLAVTTAGRVAYAGLAWGQVVAVDMVSGTVLDRLAVTGAVQDLALGGDFLYVLTGEALHAVPLLDSPFKVVGSVSSPFPAAANLRLFIGGGIAYAVHGKGFNTFNLAIPSQPVLIAAGNTTQFGWQQIVANGSGYGLAAVGPIQDLRSGPHNVSLYDLRNPSLTDQFLTTFETPGIARAVSIYNGLAYVADSEAGIQVVNYLPYDALGVPPTITLSSSFSAGVAEEGKTMRLTALVTDDVQVRNVEFYVDGVKLAADGNFPFEHRFTTPLRSGQSNFTARAKATDTGGNSTWSDLFTFNLTADATPPRVTHTSPQDRAIVPFGSVAGISATFSEPTDTNTLNIATLRLFSAGPDGMTGTGDDVAKLGGDVSSREEINGVFLTFGAPLPAGLYRATVSRFVTDLASNAPESDFAWTFEVRSGVYWISDADGFWDVASNWSTGAVPQPGDHVIIDRPAGDFTITYRSGFTALSSLNCKEKLIISGGTLSLADFSQIENKLSLTLGTLTGTGDINVGGSFTWSGGTMSGSGRTLIPAGATMTISGDVSLNGRTLNNAGTITWSAGLILSGGGAVINNLAGANFNTTFGGSSAGTRTFNNAGTFRKTGGTGPTTIDDVFNNSGSVLVENGTLTLSGNGTHTGSFMPSAGATLALVIAAPVVQNFNAGSSVMGAGNVSFNGVSGQFPGAINVNGSYDTSGDTTMGPIQVVVTVNGAYRVSGPTLNILGGTAHFNSGGTLTPVTLNVSRGTANLNSGSALAPVTLNLTGGTLGGSDTVTVSGLMTWNNNGALSGSGAVNANGGLTINGTVSITGRTLNNAGIATWSAGVITAGNGSVINNLAGATVEATVVDDLFGRSLEGTGTFNNGGTLRKAGGTGATTVGSTFNNSGSVQVETGTLRLAGSGAHTGSFVPSAGATLALVAASPVVQNFDAGSSVMGAGNVSFNGVSGQFPGAINVNGSYDTSGDTTMGPIQVVVTVNGAYRVSGPTLNILGGTAHFNSGGTLTPVTLNVSRGTANLNSGSALAPVTLNLTGGTLGGSDTVTVSGLMTWNNNGALSGSGAVNANGGLTINGTVSITGRTLNNAGIATWSAGVITAGNGSVINNLAGATVEATVVDDLFGRSLEGTGTFNNGGTLRKAGGTGTTTIGRNFNNSGSVEVETGTLRLSGSGNHTGSFVPSAGATLAFEVFNGTIHDLKDGSSVAGAGNLSFNGLSGQFASTVNVSGDFNVAGVTTVGPIGVTVNFAAAANVLNIGSTLTLSRGTVNFNSGELLTPTTLNVTGGTLGGSDTVTVSGPMTWNNNGTLSGSGAVNANGGLTINGAAFISGRTLNNGGTAVWSAGTIGTGNGAVINNLAGATFETTFDGFPQNNVSGSRLFNNAGTFRKSGGTGTTTIDNTFTNRGSVQVQTGTLSFSASYTQTAGETLLGGGNVSSPLLLQIQGGALGGSGVVSAGVISSGQVNPGAFAGLLNVTGSYTQNSDGTLNLEIGGQTAGNEFDQLSVASLASLGGTLNLSLINGFEPSLGDSFVILTYGSRTGTFATINHLDLGSGKRFQATYNPANLTLKVVPSE